MKGESCPACSSSGAPGDLQLSKAGMDLPALLLPC